MNQQPKKHPRKVSDGTQKQSNIIPAGKWHNESALASYRDARDKKKREARKARKRNR